MQRARRRWMRTLVVAVAATIAGQLGAAAIASAGENAEPAAPAWSDEFSGPAGAPPDPSVWALRTGGRWMSGGAPELQCYTKRPENVSQDGLGHLRITARYEPSNTYCLDRVTDYTSARLDSRRLKTFQYGRIEARLQLPTAAGSWPAWWLLGEQGTWPFAGEIEILEYRPGVAPDMATQRLIADTWAARVWSQRNTVTGSWGGEWHTYGIEWDQDGIDFQIDGATYWTRTPADIPVGANWRFDQPFGLLLNLAVGNAGGTPDPAQFPAQMLVDWVRVYPTAEPQPEPEPTPAPIPAPEPAPVVAAGGDVAAGNGGSTRTAAILDELDPDAVLMLGDGAYPDGTEADFAQYYEPTWGRHKAKTHPVPGNHEYHVTDAAGYFGYFGARAGPASKGWYSFDLGSWHLIALNSSDGCSAVGCGPGSEQYEWLRADLAANPAQCTLAYWHHPRWSAGNYRPGVARVAPLWDLLYDGGADVVLSGHDHSYQRFAPLDKAGGPDANGIREFVVGTGGNTRMYPVDPPGGVLEASQTGTLGVLKLTLGEGSYDWSFVPEAGGTYSDNGSTPCH